MTRIVGKHEGEQVSLLSDDARHLIWIYSRLRRVDHASSDDVDYMLKFDEVIEKFITYEVRCKWQARVINAQTLMIVILGLGIVAFAALLVKEYSK